ncbi:MAG: hypothetical protein M1429_04210 [Patescibacteria group bacterium]|nr:hypothetical protein [Patescibacteria group bacterium]
MDYFKILKKALAISLKNRYLWIFGILIGGAGGSFGSSFSNSSSYSDKWDQYFNQVSWNNFWSIYGSIILLILGIILVLGFFWAILSVVAQGAILGSVEKIEKGQKHNFWEGLRFGWHKFWRVFGVGLSLFLIVLLSVIVLVLPIIIFAVAKIYVLAVIYGIFVFLLDLVLWLFLGVVAPYIQRLAVLGDIGALEAIFSSWEFFRKNWKDILVVYLLLMATGIAASLALILVVLIIGGLLFAIGFGLYLASMAIFWMYIAVFGFAFIVLMLILGGVIKTFTSSVLTLTYLELTKKAA